MSGQTYRQVTHKLRIDGGPGQPHRESVRPREGSAKAGWGRFLDEEEPTLVTFYAGDLVDVGFLLKIGAIAPWEEVMQVG